MDFLVIVLAMATFLSTLIGGAIIIKFRKYLPYFFAFAAGSLIAVSFLDLLPESLNIATEINFPTRYIFLAVVFSFFFYSLIERFFLTHHEHHGDKHGHIMGPIGASSLVIHSFLDGAAIGAAFTVNASVGLIVALAVIFHDFTDGINTVTVMLKNKHHVSRATFFLFADAIAPVLGVLATTLIAIPENVLAIILAVFVGEFLYIGASNLLPELREHKSKWIILAMALGILVITFLTGLI
jgi:ZIP family zinc transporter